MNSWISARIQCTANDARRTSDVRIEAFHGLHQADVALLNQVAQRQAIADIPARYVHHETQMRQHQRAGGLDIVVLFITLGQRALLLGAQHAGTIDGLD